MTTWFWIVLGVAVLAGIVEGMFGRRLPKPYRYRRCTGRLWRERFPSASKSDIRRFLEIFREAFFFGARYRLKFTPDDKVTDIYNALYPRKWMADALETVVLLRSLETEYRIEFPESFAETEEVTLGDIFEYIMKHLNQSVEDRFPLAGRRCP